MTQPADPGTATAPAPEAAGGLPPDAAAAAIAELEKLDQSTQVASDPGRYVPGAPPPGRAYSVPLPPSAVGGYGRPQEGLNDFGQLPMARTASTLEDLYAIYPSIGDGIFRLRVTRMQPKAWRGTPVAGYLGDLDEKIGLDEFTNRFGGGTYRVAVLGPLRGKFDDAGAPIIRQLPHSAEVTVPGPPALNSLPVREEDGMFGATGRGQTPYNQVFRTGDDSSVQIKRMEIEQRERERAAQQQQQLYSQVFSQRPSSNEAVQVLADTSVRSIGEVRSAHEQHLVALREQNKELMDDLRRKDAESRELRDKLVHVGAEAAKSEMLQQELATTKEKLGGEINALRQQAQQDLLHARDQHALELKSLRERADKDITDLRDRNEREVRELNDKHRDELSRVSTRYTEERALLNESLNEKLRTFRDDMDRRERDVKESHARELSTLKDAQERELRVLRESMENRSVMVEKTGELQLSSTTDQLRRVQDENDRLRRDNEELRIKINKDPITAIREAKELAGLVGMTEGGSDEKPDGEFDWKREAAGVIRTAVERLPEAIQNLQNLRQQNAANGQQAMMAQQQLAMEQQQMAAGGGPAQLGPGQPQVTPQQRRRAGQQQRAQWQPGMPPPGFAGPPPPPPTSGPVGAQPPPGPVHFDQPIRRGPLPPATPAVPLAADPMQPPVSAAPQPVQPEFGAVPGAVPQQQAAAVSQQQAAAQPQQLNVTDAQLAEFFTELEKAIASNMVPASTFAAEFVTRVGADQTRMLLHAIHPDQILAMAERGKNSPIVTRDGQKYVYELWGEAIKLVGG